MEYGLYIVLAVIVVSALVLWKVGKVSDERSKVTLPHLNLWWLASSLYKEGDPYRYGHMAKYLNKHGWSITPMQVQMTFEDIAISNGLHELDIRNFKAHGKIPKPPQQFDVPIAGSYGN